MKTYPKLTLFALAGFAIPLHTASSACLSASDCLKTCNMTYCCPNGLTGTTYSCPDGWTFVPPVIEIGSSRPATCKRDDSPQYSDDIGYKVDTYGTCDPTSALYECYSPSNDQPSIGINKCVYCSWEPGGKN